MGEEDTYVVEDAMKYSHEEKELRLYTELYTSTCMRVGGEYEGCGGYVHWIFRTWYSLFWNIRQYHVQVTYTHAHITVTYTHTHTTVTYTHTYTTYIHTCTYHLHTHMHTSLLHTHTSLTYTHAHITAHKMHSGITHRLYVHIWMGTTTANRFSRIAWVW